MEQLSAADEKMLDDFSKLVANARKETLEYLVIGLTVRDDQETARENIAVVSQILRDAEAFQQ